MGSHSVHKLLDRLEKTTFLLFLLSHKTALLLKNTE
jgi:hypothetical protein